MAHDGSSKAWAALDKDSTVVRSEGDGCAGADRNRIWARAGDSVAVVEHPGGDSDDEDICVCRENKCFCIKPRNMLAY